MACDVAVVILAIKEELDLPAVLDSLEARAIEIFVVD